jgi:glycosyltransferase involved in cell wall biosynthesis
MKRLKYYVLTSSNLDLLKRHASIEYSNIPIDLLVVVINTKDKVYEKEASEYCQQAGIEYYITESNGTPGRGKNSLLEKFLESDNDYCVQIDGDDYLTPHGVYVYNNLANTKNPPDAVCLTKQISMMYDPEGSSKIPMAMRFFHIDYDVEIAKLQEHEVDDRVIEFYQAQKKYSEKEESHCRVTWYSRNAAEHRFLENIHIGEDTLHYFKLKHEHFAGRLVFMNNVESPPTYIYDQTIDGIVKTNSQDPTDVYAWMGKYMQILRQYEKEGTLYDNSTHSLPLLKIDYPVEYVPDDYGYTGNMVYAVTDNLGNSGNMEHPANASEKSLIAKYQTMFQTDEK